MSKSLKHNQLRNTSKELAGCEFLQSPEGLVLTLDIFDKINETEPGFNGEVQLTDALSKLYELPALMFEGNVFNIENRIEWIKSSRLCNV